MFSTAMIFTIGMKVFLVLILFCDVNITKTVDFDTSLEPKYSNRLLLPHRYWHVSGSRNSNPFLRRFLSLRNVNNLRHVSNRNTLETRSHSSKLNGYFPHQNHSNFPFASNSLRNSGFKVTAEKREIAKFPRSGGYANLVNKNKVIDERNNTFPNSSSVVKRESQLKGKRETSISRFKREFHKLRKFNLMYAVALFLIFVPVFSMVVICVPLASCFCSIFRRTGTDNGNKPTTPKSGSNLTIVAVEKNHEADSAENTKPATQTKSIEHMYNNFVSNKIDQGGDTVAKEMKIERWMEFSQDREQESRPVEQRIPAKPKVKQKFQKPFANMVPVAEYLSDSDSTPDADSTLYHWNDTNTGNNKASKQRSHPFPFQGPVTVNNYTRHPRNIHSLLGQPKSSKPATQTESIEHMYNNFVCNEIEQEGDAVAKNMKIERWMEFGQERQQEFRPNEQGIPEKPKVQHKFQKPFANMEPVAEEASDSDSTLDTDTLYRRNDTNTGNNKARKQHPRFLRFQGPVIADNCTKHPRNILSLPGRPSVNLERKCYSTMNM